MQDLSAYWPPDYGWWLQYREKQQAGRAAR